MKNHIPTLRESFTVALKTPFVRNVFLTIVLLCMPFAASASVCETSWDGDKIVVTLSGRPSNLRIPLKDRNQNSNEVTLAQVRAFHEAKDRISRVVGLSPTFILCGDNSPNAFAGSGPNGPFVGVTLGMLRLADGDPDMAAAVIGHEIAHHIKQHGTESKTRDTVIGVIGLIAGIALEYNLQKKGVVGVGMDLGTMGANLTARKFDRDQEREADDLAFQYMIAAGFNPTGSLTLAERFSQLGHGSGGWFYDSHPGWDEREQLFRTKIANSSEAQQIIAKAGVSSNGTTETQKTLAGASAGFLPTKQPIDAQKIFQSGVTSYQEGQYSKALEQFKRAADLNYPLANWAVGLLFAKGQGTPVNLAEANSWYRKAAEQGIAIAQGSLGYNLENGLGINKDETEAVKWYRKAAEQGLAPSQDSLGLMYIRGQGIDKNYGEAMKWFRKAAEKGFASAQSNLGAMYANGHGTSKDETEAVKWYQKAAEQGNAKAQDNLGLMYINGHGIAKSDDEAMKWFRKAAEKGLASAQSNLGAMYATGRGTSKNETEAVKWFQKAAEQGNPKAQYNLGSMYATGRGVDKDEAEALKWYRKAAEQGNSLAEAALRKLAPVSN
jgi:uncharacterized protein